MDREEDELEDDFRDPDCVYVAEDVPVDNIIPEDVAIAICANYGRARQFLQKRKLGRGFCRPHLKGGGKYGKRQRQRQAQRMDAKV